jgi:hypothetical protein
MGSFTLSAYGISYKVETEGRVSGCFPQTGKPSVVAFGELMKLTEHLFSADEDVYRSPSSQPRTPGSVPLSNPLTPESGAFGERDRAQRYIIPVTGAALGSEKGCRLGTYCTNNGGFVFVANLN